MQRQSSLFNSFVVSYFLFTLKEKKQQRIFCETFPIRDLVIYVYNVFVSAIIIVEYVVCRVCRLRSGLLCWIVLSVRQSVR